MYGNGVTFLDYEKITDDLVFFGKGIILRFNVSLARKDKNGMRDFFHKEYQYSSKYPDKDKVITLRRSFDYYLSIDVKDSFENGVIIREKDMMILKIRMNDVINWFGTLFKIKNNTLIISGAYKPITITNLGVGRSLTFEPTVVQFQDGSCKEGVRMTLCDNLFVDIDIDQYMQFAYIISTINLYQAASTMLNYLDVQFGQNLFRFEDSYRTNPNDSSPQEIDGNIKKTKEINKREKSFFDKMDDL